MHAKASVSKRSAKSTVVTVPEWLAQAPFWIMVVILISFTFIRIVFKDIPIERDEGSYAYMGHLLLQGGTPYIDFYEMKPPGLYYSYALLSGLSGGDLAMMHVWMAILLAIGGWCMFVFVSKIAEKGAAVMAVLAWCALGLTASSSGFSIQAEHLVGFFAVMGLAFLVWGLRENRKWLVLAAGAALCYGLLIKQNGLFFALLSITIVPIFHKTENPGGWIKNTIRDGGWLAMGAAIPAFIFGGILAMKGALDEFWFWNIEYPKSYTSSITWELGRTLLENGVKKMYAEYPLFWILGFGGAIGIWFTRIAGWKKWTVAGFLLMAMLSVTPGKRFYGHYFLHFFPALAVGCGAAVFALGEWTSGLMSRYVRQLGTVLLVGVVFITLLGMKEGYYFRPNFTKILRETYGSNPFPESKQMADYLNSKYQEGDGLVVFGSEPQLYAYTLANAPTRHHFMAFLLKNHPKEKDWQNEVIADIEAKPPKYAVWVQHPLTWLPAEGADQRIIQWSWSFIHRDYTPIAWYEQVGGGQVKVIEGPDAAQYQPTGQQYMILLERNEASITLPVE